MRSTDVWELGMPVPPGMEVRNDGATGPDGAVHGAHLVPARDRRVPLDASKARVVGPGMADRRNPRVA